MKYLPVGLDVRDRICIVVGGGQIGTRKVANLLRAGAAVTVISPLVSDEVGILAEKEEIQWLRREIRGGDLAGAFLTVAATENEEVNALVVRDALDAGSLVCDASSAARSQVIFGALLEGEGVTLAVFTDGQDPARARKTRDRIAALEEDWKEE
ncbi:MAG: bifunctional precorrin-2 dehydrogenase/sirohydrochlorin ferrochelatase [Gemmatimonadetes bacterium]|nr:bifunctional precorrin-2 dehydrogenase/sirohydrochlorin ferrochelatase [Gemmatimonadota bacterium]NNM04418.1 bifunctional precorrin-2 dehydrogenase/sirohydrochlorin ferrochelatase [Gemmatimonadota bacterium]